MAPYKQDPPNHHTNDIHGDQPPNLLWIAQALTNGGPPHMSNLGNLIKHYPQYIQMGMEHIATYIRPPWWKAPAIIEISTASKDKATKAHQQQLRQIPTEDLIIYTDGSSHNGHIGAAIYSPTTNVRKGEYIGTDETHNVYAAELTAIQMAVTEFEKRINKYTNVIPVNVLMSRYPFNVDRAGGIDFVDSVNCVQDLLDNVLSH